MLETLVSSYYFIKRNSLEAIFTKAYVFNLMNLLSVVWTEQSSDNKIISEEDKSYLMAPRPERVETISMTCD